MKLPRASERVRGLSKAGVTAEDSRTGARNNVLTVPRRPGLRKRPGGHSSVEPFSRCWEVRQVEAEAGVNLASRLPAVCGLVWRYRERGDGGGEAAGLAGGGR